MNNLWDTLRDLISPRPPVSSEQLLKSLELREQGLEKRAELLEKIAASAEKEAKLRMKIVEANKRIKSAKPRNKWIPLFVVIGIILVIMLLAQMCQTT